MRVFDPPAHRPEGKRQRHNEDQYAITDKDVLKSDVLNEARITQYSDRNAHRNAKRSYCRVPQHAGIAACLVDLRKKVCCLLRRLVVDLGATKSAYVGRGINRLPAMRAIENIKFF